MKHEFDNLGNVGTVEVLDDGRKLVISSGGSEQTLIEAARDQWGVFYFLPSNTIAQEDETRSFLDALIKGLTELRQMNENTTDSTPAPDAQPIAA